MSCFRNPWRRYEHFYLAKSFCVSRVVPSVRTVNGSGNAIDIRFGCPGRKLFLPVMWYSLDVSLVSVHTHNSKGWINAFDAMASLKQVVPGHFLREQRSCQVGDPMAT